MLSTDQLIRIAFVGAIFLGGAGVGYFFGVAGSEAPRPSTSTVSTPTRVGLSDAERLQTPFQLAAEGDHAPGNQDNSHSLTGAVAADGSLVTRFAECLLERSEEDRHAQWLALLKRLKREDAREIRELFRRMEASGRQFEFEWLSFWPKWGQVDGDGALAHLLHSENESWRSDGAGLILRGWAQKDPDEALRALKALENTPLYGGALAGFVEGYARNDYRKATQFALANVKGESDTAAAVAASLTEQSLQQAGLSGMLEWFDALPNDPTSAALKQAAAAQVFARLEHAGQETALEWLAKNAAMPWRDDDAIGSAAGRVANTDPARALEWLTSLPPSSAGGNYPGMNRVVRRLAATDPGALEQWLRQPKSQDIQDQALAAYGKSLLEKDRDAANAWFAQIQDPRWKPQSGELALEGHVIQEGNGEVLRGFSAKGVDLLFAPTTRGTTAREIYVVKPGGENVVRSRVIVPAPSATPSQ